MFVCLFNKPKGFKHLLVYLFNQETQKSSQAILICSYNLIALFYFFNWGSILQMTKDSALSIDFNKLFPFLKFY